MGIRDPTLHRSYSQIEESANYLLRNYELIEKAYGMNEWLAVKGEVILGHNSCASLLTEQISEIFGRDFDFQVLNLKISQNPLAYFLNS